MLSAEYLNINSEEIFVYAMSFINNYATQILMTGHSLVISAYWSQFIYYITRIRILTKISMVPWWTNRGSELVSNFC